MSEAQSPDPYHGLISIDPSEWLNIPRPIIDSLTVLKDIAIENTTKIREFSSSINIQQANVNEEMRKIGKELSYIKNTFAKYQEDSMIMMENVNTSISSDVAKFKSNLLVDLDYKQKNNDSKIGYLEEQIFHTRKYTSSLPTILEITNKINDAVVEMRAKVKVEIKESMLMPEIKGVNFEIKETSQNLKNIISDTETRVVERIKKVNESVESLNNLMEIMQKNLNSFQVKYTELSEFTDMNASKIQELNIILDDNDKNNKAALKKVDAKFNSVYANISDVQKDLVITNSNFPNIENEFNSIRELISQVEMSLNESLKSLVEESKKTQKQIQIEKVQPIKKSSQVASSKVSENLIQDFKNEIFEMKNSLSLSAKDSEEKLKMEISKNMKEFNELVNVMRKENEESFKEIQNKLNWLPVNVTDMTGMNAQEARLFTLEARLRSEENSRIKSFNLLGKMIESLKYPKEFVLSDRLARGKDTPEGMYTVEILKKLGEHDKKSQDFSEGYSHLLDSAFRDDHFENIRKHHRTPKSRDYVVESGREARTSSVMGRRILRQTLN